MAVIWSRPQCVNVKLCILIRISLKFVPKGPIDNTSGSVQVMVWRRTGDKPLHEPMLTQFLDAYTWHQEMELTWVKQESIYISVLLN